MSLRQKIEEDINSALKAGESERLGVLRMVKSAIHNKEIDDKSELEDDQVIKMLQKEVKQREDAIKIYQDADKEDRIAKEESEIKILKEYLPKELSSEELDKLIDETIEETSAESMADMGKVMGALNKKVAGRADGSKMAGLVKSKLS